MWDFVFFFPCVQLDENKSSSLFIDPERTEDVQLHRPAQIPIMQIVHPSDQTHSTRRTFRKIKQLSPLCIQTNITSREEGNNRVDEE